MSLSALHLTRSAGLSVTLFDRLQCHYGDSCCRMLTQQYRMNGLIAHVSSEELCVGPLRDA